MYQGYILRITVSGRLTWEYRQLVVSECYILINTTVFDKDWYRLSIIAESQQELYLEIQIHIKEYRVASGIHIMQYRVVSGIHFKEFIELYQGYWLDNRVIAEIHIKEYRVVSGIYIKE